MFFFTFNIAKLIILLDIEFEAGFYLIFSNVGVQIETEDAMIMRHIQPDDWVCYL